MAPGIIVYMLTDGPVTVGVRLKVVHFVAVRERNEVRERYILLSFHVCCFSEIPCKMYTIVTIII